jgi:CHAT domain-containing protein/tetratricopeptide (TPR) repeat protein
VTSGRSVRAGSGCPDPGLVAARAEGRLTGEDAARIAEHLASCPECSEVLAETVRFLREEEADRPPAPAAIPFARRRVLQAAVALAVAAALVVAFRLVGRTGRAPSPGSLVAELAAAMGERRFVEPRLTGGFRHGPLLTLRGEAPRGLDAYPPSVLSAVAQIRERVEADSSPSARGALAITYLVSGDVDAAVKTLESATSEAPRNARLQSDLAAAYLVRASRQDEVADLPRALEAAERAIALEGAPDEAWFNRALALEGLHLTDAARKAWEDYLAHDSTSGWADEARSRLEELHPAHRSSVEEDRARVREALRGGATAVERLADETPSLLRDYFQDELLPSWAEAYLAGRAEATTLAGHALLAGDALLDRTGDALPRETARALALEPSSGSSGDPPREQALGFLAFRDAMRLYDAQRPSCAPFREARRLLEAGGSPYAARIRERVVFACLYPEEPQAALAELGRLERDADERGYTHLLGLVRYLQGLVLWHRGNLTSSLERYGLARTAFRAVGDTEREDVAFSTLAETFHMLGESRRAWAARKTALASLGQVRDLRRRHGVLEEAALACLDERLLRSALDFQTAVVEAARVWSNAVALSDALVRRAEILGRLGSKEAAAADLAEARRWIPQIADGPEAQRFAAEADAVEGEIFADREPERAAALLGEALRYFERDSPVRVPGIRSLLARALAAQGLDDEAEAQLEAGIEALESGRASLKDAALQVSFFDQSTPLFDDMVRLQLERRHDPGRALLFVERGRARQLADSLAGHGPDPLHAEGGEGPPGTPLDPVALQRELPNGVVLVYYVSRGDCLLMWALARDESRFAKRHLPAKELQRLVGAHQAALESRAPIAVVREQAARLYDELVRPLGPVLRARPVLIAIPDATLQAVAFAGLWDRDAGRYLVEDHLVGLAPSGTVFVRGSFEAGLALRGAAPALLAVGNPRLDRDVAAGLPSLRGAEAEATEIARLYPRSEVLTGAAATKSAFLRLASDSEVVHFGGHAVHGDAPWTTRLLLAPDPERGDTGALYVRDLDGKDLRHTRVVVLAACRTATGPGSDVEGALSLARPFLAAGVPSVVGSLWDIDDAASRRFFVAFHRALLAEGEALLAVRDTQLALCRDRDPVLSHPASWAGFVSMGGLDPRALGRARDF